MNYKTLLLLTLAACGSNEAPKAHPVEAAIAQGSAASAKVLGIDVKPPAPPRNFVCERLHAENEKAPCEPEYTDVGELHTYTARIIVGGQTVACAINSQQVSVVCGPLFYVAQQAPTEKPPAETNNGVSKPAATEPKKK